MPVYHRSKLIHIHIPKTAGTAIESFFHSIGDMVWGLDSWLGQEHIDDRWYEFQHLSMAELLTFTQGEFNHFHSFAVVRNPYSRLVSEYLWRQRIEYRDTHARMLFFASFKEFVHKIPPDMDKNGQLYLVNADQAKTNFLIHVRPQHQYVYSHDGEQLVDNLLRYEQLETEFGEFVGRYGLKNDMIRVPRDQSFEAYFDREMLDHVNTTYVNDFKLGSYAML